MKTIKFYNDADDLSVIDDNSIWDTIELGNGANNTVSAVLSESDTIILGNGAGDTVNLIGAGGDAITLGDGPGDAVHATPNQSDIGIRSGTINLGDGAGDTVSIDGSRGNMITLGNGAGDTVRISGFDVPVSGNIIRVGDGDGDLVEIRGSFLASGNTVVVGDGADDRVSFLGSNETITIGDGNRATVVNNGGGINNAITLGNGNGDVVDDSKGRSNTITVGNGDDTIYVGTGDAITVGTGHDTFVFEQKTAGALGVVGITGFDASKDGLIFSNQFVASVSLHDDAQGNAVVSVGDDGTGTITLFGVHTADLNPWNFQFFDPAAVTANPFQVSDNSGILLGGVSIGSTTDVGGSR